MPHLFTCHGRIMPRLAELLLSSIQSVNTVGRGLVKEEYLVIILG